jgi:hypothetical protein
MIDYSKNLIGIGTIIHETWVYFDNIGVDDLTILMTIRRISDNYMFDFYDNTFKLIPETSSLILINSDSQPGLYFGPITISDSFEIDEEYCVFCRSTDTTYAPDIEYYRFVDSAAISIGPIDGMSFENILKRLLAFACGEVRNNYPYTNWVTYFDQSGNVLFSFKIPVENTGRFRS